MTISDLCYRLYRNLYEDSLAIDDLNQTYKNYYIFSRDSLKADFSKPIEFEGYTERFGYVNSNPVMRDVVGESEFIYTIYKNEDFIKELLNDDVLFKQYREDLTELLDELEIEQEGL